MADPNNAIYEAYQIDQDNLFANINFDDASLESLLADPAFTDPFDPALTMQGADESSLNIEAPSEPVVAGQGPLDVQFADVSYAPEPQGEHLTLAPTGPLDFQFDDPSFYSPKTLGQQLSQAPMNQVPTADYFNPGMLFNNMDGLGFDSISQMGSDFTTFNMGGTQLPMDPTYGNDFLTLPVPLPPQPELTSHRVKSGHHSRHMPSASMSSVSSTESQKRKSSSGISDYGTPEIQHTLDPRKKRKLSSRPPSPRIDESLSAEPLRRPSVTFRGKRLDLRSDKIPRHTRQKNERPEPRDWYGPLQEKPPNWGSPDHRGEPTFKYNQYGELEPGRYYSNSEMKEYFFGPKWHDKDAMPPLLEGVPVIKSKKRQGLTLWIGLPGSECNWRYPRQGVSTKCRFKECMHDNHTIRQGEYWVIFDERMNVAGDVINPFYNAGYVHLDCLEHIFDLVELWQQLDVRVDDRDFKYEEHGYFKLGRKHPRIVDEVAKWWKDEYKKWSEYRAGGPKRSRHFDSSLGRRLVAFDLKHESGARKNARARRGGNDSSRHKGDVMKQKRWNAYKEFDLIGKDGIPVPDADKRLKEHLAKAERDEKRRKAKIMKRRQRMAAMAKMSLSESSPSPSAAHTPQVDPNLGGSFQADLNSAYPSALSLPHAVDYTYGGLTFPATQQPVYPQFAATADQLCMPMPMPMPMPSFAPEAPLAPIQEEQSRKRGRDETDSDEGHNAVKRQRQDAEAAAPACSTVTGTSTNPTANATFDFSVPDFDFLTLESFMGNAWAGLVDSEANFYAAMHTETNEPFVNGYSLDDSIDPRSLVANNGPGAPNVDTSCIDPALQDNAASESSDSLFGGSCMSEISDDSDAS
ncbi:hypothetical protein F4810DRAFT_709155 [Camillea tinctor]|nr:hypothetical protein F4810DRAFT_709155 [Camillea tinctor]